MAPFGALRNFGRHRVTPHQSMDSSSPTRSTASRVTAPSSVVIRCVASNRPACAFVPRRRVSVPQNVGTATQRKQGFRVVEGTQSKASGAQCGRCERSGRHDTSKLTPRVLSRDFPVEGHTSTECPSTVKAVGRDTEVIRRSNSLAMNFVANPYFSKIP